MAPSPKVALLALASLAAAGRAHGAPSDTHASVSFFRGSDADLYSKEIAASLEGVLRYNYVSEDGAYPAGFVRASPPPQPWYKTFWTRDGGTFLRELVKWGYLRQASQEAACLMELAGKNPEGYHAFPRYFDSRAPRAGEELDGTSAIIIGMTMLEEDLPSENPIRAALYDFLHEPSSPVRFIEFELRGRPLLQGQGEFGGGMGTKGPYCNVVQNGLAALALRAYAGIESDAGAAAEARSAADRIEAGMRKYLVGPDGAWIWCVDPKTLAPDARILNSTMNKGFGGIDGVLSMYADVGGLEPGRTAKDLYDVSMATFEKLYETPERKRQFDRTGFWSQFDLLGKGVLTSPSYGQGYAIQDMLLSDRLAMASKAIDFLASNTFHPVEGYALTRTSPYYFYERVYSPEAPGKVDMAAGCGALNLVNVAEQLKVARLIVGIDDTDPGTLKLVPRLPDGWTGFSAKDWPVHTREGVVHISIDYERRGNGAALHVTADAPLESVVVRMPDSGKWTYRQFTGRSDISM